MAEGTRQARLEEILAKVSTVQENQTGLLEKHTALIEKQNSTIDLLKHSMQDLTIGMQTLDAKVEQFVRRNSGSSSEIPPHSPETTAIPKSGPNNSADQFNQLKSMKLEVPRFSGENPLPWISRIQRYFDFYNTPDPQRLIIASFHLDGDALDWYDWMNKNQLLATWKDFLTAVDKRFGPSEYEDSFGKLSKLTQQNSLGEYQHRFEQLANKSPGVPRTIVSDRDPIFVSKFWQELFKLSGTSLHMSSAYHPQSDGQTEVLNRCLEQYLRAFASEQPQKWNKFLLWAELSYNTSFHSAILMSPFEAVFGRPPPTLTSYIAGSSSIEAVDQSLMERDALVRSLRMNLERAQTRMRNQADKHRQEISFQEGDWCYIRLQPHKQVSVTGQKFTKLSKRFYGPFRVVKRIGVVAYRLALPDHCKIHPVFHVSVLKLCPNPESAPPMQLPPLAMDNQPLITPLAVLDFRKIDRDGIWISQVLVQWEGLALEETSWEDLSAMQSLFPSLHLEDKVLFQEQGNDTRRGQRNRSQPKKLADYITDRN